ncbi:MAG: glutamate racemase [Chthoniobacterales bacterium]
MTQPIGVFDSGIGGLTVVAAIRTLLPNESIFYIGDTARVPYGNKSPATVERYSIEIGSRLAEAGCKAVVVACNSAASVAVPRMQAELPVPVLGVIDPGARAAIHATRNDHIGVIGTRATIKAGAYEKAIRALRPNATVTGRACPLLVPLIEEGRLDGSITDAVIREYLAPMLAGGIDTLVLGCTHYPLARSAIERVAGPGVTLVDSAENTARALQQLLIAEGVSAASKAVGTLRVALTDMPDHFLRVAEEALQLEIKKVELCDVASAPVVS